MIRQCANCGVWYDDTGTYVHVCPLSPAPRSLRDHFAASVLPGLVRQFGATDPEMLAATAYRIADAMLKAREGKP